MAELVPEMSIVLTHRDMQLIVNALRRAASVNSERAHDLIKLSDQLLTADCVRFNGWRP